MFNNFTLYYIFYLCDNFMEFTFYIKLFFLKKDFIFYIESFSINLIFPKNEFNVIFKITFNKTFLHFLLKYYYNYSKSSTNEQYNNEVTLLSIGRMHA